MASPSIDPMKQRSDFLGGEGDAWFRRNEHALAAVEGCEFSPMLRSLAVTPRSALEIGCSNGTRLDALCREFGCEGSGIDPSAQAIATGTQRYPGLRLTVGTAESLPYGDAAFDLVVFGFCLYLCDRADLFRIACEADRCLADGGFLVIKEFMPPFPYRNDYAPRPGLQSFKFDHRRMFLWNPAYHECAFQLSSHAGDARPGPDDRVATCVMRKDVAHGWPRRPAWD